MTVKTQSTDSSDESKRFDHMALGRRLEDQIRLRELELQTNFKVEVLTEALNMLKTDFLSWRDSLNERLTKVDSEVYGLKTRLTIVIALLIGQIIGLPSGLSKLIGM